LLGRNSRPTGCPVELQSFDRSGLELRLLTNILLPVTHSVSAARFRLDRTPRRRLTAHAIRFLFASNQIFNDLGTTADDPLGFPEERSTSHRPRKAFWAQSAKSVPLNSDGRITNPRPEIFIAHSVLTAVRKKTPDDAHNAEAVVRSSNLGNSKELLE
jgi:hypothetical protein